MVRDACIYLSLYIRLFYIVINIFNNKMSILIFEDIL